VRRQFLLRDADTSALDVVQPRQALEYLPLYVVVPFPAPAVAGAAVRTRAAAVAPTVVRVLRMVASWRSGSAGSVGVVRFADHRPK